MQKKSFLVLPWDEVLILVCHWFAALWAMTIDLVPDGTPTWLDEIDTWWKIRQTWHFPKSQFQLQPETCTGVQAVLFLELHWSCQTCQDVDVDNLREKSCHQWPGIFRGSSRQLSMRPLEWSPGRNLSASTWHLTTSAAAWPRNTINTMNTTFRWHPGRYRQIKSGQRKTEGYCSKRTSVSFAICLPCLPAWPHCRRHLCSKTSHKQSFGSEFWDLLWNLKHWTTQTNRENLSLSRRASSNRCD